MTISLITDLALAGLLAATLIYGAMLNRRLARLREDRDGLAEVVRQFNEATSRAMTGMDGLKAAADSSGASLQGATDRARALVEDLNFLVERGERAAERLEAATRPAGAALRAAPPVRAEAAPPRPAVPAAAPSGERQALLKSLQGMR